MVLESPILEFNCRTRIYLNSPLIASQFLISIFISSVRWLVELATTPERWRASTSWVSRYQRVTAATTNVLPAPRSATPTSRACTQASRPISASRRSLIYPTGSPKSGLRYVDKVFGSGRTNFLGEFLVHCIIHPLITTINKLIGVHVYVKAYARQTFILLVSDVPWNGYENIISIIPRNNHSFSPYGLGVWVVKQQQNNEKK